MPGSFVSSEARPWMVSLHGGHSSDYCDHAFSTLPEMLAAAAAAGYHTFGVSEHAPRSEERFLYSEERARGWDMAKVCADFERYAAALPALVEEFADRLVVLRGFEAEIVPSECYRERMRGIRARTLPDGSPAFDYFVGSVHYVGEIQIDGRPENYVKAVENAGGVEALAVRYYDLVAEMTEALKPDVVGHFDLVKRNAEAAGFGTLFLQTANVRAAAMRALDAVQAHDAVLDLNTAGWRKGLGEPFPAPWLVEEARRREIGFCFGDDSHRATDVGAGVTDARNYLLRLGVNTVTVLTREGDRVHGPVVRKVVSLDE